MSFTDWLAFKKLFALAMKFFEVSESFPKEEEYSLTNQIRRPSRSVSANISEAYRKKSYPKHFVKVNLEVGRLINYMINYPGRFGVKELTVN